ncbi:MAG TPA: hypothetical protein VNS63_24080, partial [Blastocatellia bacterium]|nr:hypothetical protein [Blastocatellia bacterium]
MIDGHMIAAARLILAISAILIVEYGALSSFDSEGTRVVLVLYLAYSGALYVAAVRRKRLRRSMPAWSYWTDIGWYALLVAFTGGASSIFFFGFSFTILLASFEWGARAGLVATFVSALLFITVSVADPDESSTFAIRRLAVRLVYLLVLGYLMAHWGGVKIKLHRQLELLKEITNVSQARLGVDHLIDSTIDQLRAFYEADTYLLVVTDPDTLEYRLHRVKRFESVPPKQAEPVPEEMVQVMLSLPANDAVISCEGFG